MDAEKVSDMSHEEVLDRLRTHYGEDDMVAMRFNVSGTKMHIRRYDGKVAKRRAARNRGPGYRGDMPPRINMAALDGHGTLQPGDVVVWQGRPPRLPTDVK